MATLRDIGLGISPGTEILQPMLKNRYKVEFIGIHDFDGGPATQSKTDLTIQVITTDLPKVSFEEITLDRYNSRAYIGGKHTFEAINMVFEADVGGRVYRAVRGQLESQQRLIGNTSNYAMGTRRTAGEYKFATKIMHLDGGWSGEGTDVLHSWILEGCWFQQLDFGDMDYAANETVKVTATVRFDHARLDIAPTSGAISSNGGSAPDLVGNL